MQSGEARNTALTAADLCTACCTRYLSRDGLRCVFQRRRPRRVGRRRGQRMYHVGRSSSTKLPRWARLTQMPRSSIRPAIRRPSADSMTSTNWNASPGFKLASNMAPSSTLVQNGSSNVGFVGIGATCTVVPIRSRASSNILAHPEVMLCQCGNCFERHMIHWWEAASATSAYHDTREPHATVSVIIANPYQHMVVPRATK